MPSALPGPGTPAHHAHLQSEGGRISVGQPPGLLRRPLQRRPDADWQVVARAGADVHPLCDLMGTAPSRYPIWLSERPPVAQGGGRRSAHAVVAPPPSASKTLPSTSAAAAGGIGS